MFEQLYASLAIHVIYIKCTIDGEFKALVKLFSFWREYYFFKCQKL